MEVADRLAELPAFRRVFRCEVEGAWRDTKRHRRGADALQVPLSQSEVALTEH